jgi:hypothetical protein
MNSPSRITVQVPLRFVSRGGRKAVYVPVACATPQRHHDNALLKALARAYRWRKLIEDGEYTSITELADAKGVNQSYACRLLRITLLAPELVTAILDGKQPAALTLKNLMKQFPLEWVWQQDGLALANEAIHWRTRRTTAQ